MHVTANSLFIASLTNGLQTVYIGPHDDETMIYLRYIYSYRQAYVSVETLTFAVQLCIE